MPKQIYNIRAFHGGINSNSDARDIAENELHEAIDIMVDKIGQTRMMGAASTMSPPAARTNSIEPGYGLFQFSHDRVDGHTSSAGSSDEETGADYLAFSDPDGSGTGNVSIYSAEDTTWGDPITGMTNNTGGQRKDVFYFVDGNLRVCDSEFGNTNTNKWYGYIERSHFDGTATADSYNAWYCKDAEIKMPNNVLIQGALTGSAQGSSTETRLFTGTTHAFTGGVDNTVLTDKIITDLTAVTLTLGSSARQGDTVIDTPDVSPSDGTEWDGKTWALFPKAGDGFHLNFTADGPEGSGGSIPAGNYDFAMSYVYDAEPGAIGSQESLPREFHGGGFDSAEFAISGTEVIPGIDIYATSPYDPRLTGGRVYWRKQTSSGSGQWYHLLDVSLKDGVREGIVGSYVPWVVKYSQCVSASVGEINSVSSLTWEDLNAMPQDAPSTTAKYKTAIVSNRRAYIGNVQYGGTTYGDAVFKSPINKFDTFSDVRKLEASINDGDSIVKLEAYADRLLIFKKKKLELLNISQELEFIEDTFVHKGVSHPAATCKTDFGIAWVNEQGCYLYDGQRVNNLLEKGGRQIIKESDWATFATANSMIGYIPSKRQILVVKDCTHSSAGDVFLYDIVTQSWVYGNSKCSDSIRFTNFVTDWNGDLIYIETDDTGTPKKWSDASGSSTGLHIQTKDLDFGQPGVRKKIYKVYITYRGDASNVQVNYGSDGGALSGNFFTINSDGSTTGGSAAHKCLVNAGTDDWLKAELKPSVSINNVSSFQLKLHGDGLNAIAADFEIDSISIVYRTKGIK